APAKGPARLMTAGLGVVTNALTKILGAQVLKDMSMFVSAFDTLFGGFLAVSYTDFVQGVMMFLALLAVPLVGLTVVGGPTGAAASIRDVDPGLLSLTSGATVLGVVSALAWGLGYFGQPHIIVRFMAADSIKTIPNARRIGMAWMILTLAGAVAVGFFGIAYFAGHPELAGPVSQNGERVFLELVKILFNPWVAGIILSGVLAAVMSTLSAQLLVSSSALTQDFYKAMLRKSASQTELVWVGRAMVLLIALVAIGIASNPDSKVLGLVSYAWAGFGAAFGPVVLISLLWKRMTRNGALAGMLVGAVTVVVWKEFIGLGLYEIIPGFILASIAIYVVSKLGAEPAPSIVKRFEEADADYHAG
ncbi:MAG: sodium:solute symporter family transporter, partial [Gammaproteobacteria bacterium]